MRTAKQINADQTGVSKFTPRPDWRSDSALGIGLVEKVFKSDDDALKLKYFKSGMTRVFDIIDLDEIDRAAILAARDNLKPEDLK